MYVRNNLLNMFARQSLACGRRTMFSVPQIDVGPLLSCDEDDRALRDVSEQIKEASSSHGFFQIVNHGWSEDKRRNVFRETRQVFSVPEEEKRLNLVSNDAPGFTRGYITVGGESGSDLNECKEAFSYGFDWQAEMHEKENSLEGPNRWPVSFGGRTTMDDFYKDMTTISEAVVRGLSLSLGYDRSYLDRYCETGRRISLMRLFHYLPYDDPAVCSRFGDDDSKKVLSGLRLAI